MNTRILAALLAVSMGAALLPSNARANVNCKSNNAVEAAAKRGKKLFNEGKALIGESKRFEMLGESKRADLKFKAAADKFKAAAANFGEAYACTNKHEQLWNYARAYEMAREYKRSCALFALYLKSEGLTEKEKNEARTKIRMLCKKGKIVGAPANVTPPIVSGWESHPDKRVQREYKGLPEKAREHEKRERRNNEIVRKAHQPTAPSVAATANPTIKDKVTMPEPKIFGLHRTDALLLGGSLATTIAGSITWRLGYNAGVDAFNMDTQKPGGVDEYRTALDSAKFQRNLGIGITSAGAIATGIAIYKVITRSTDRVSITPTAGPNGTGMALIGTF